MIKFNAVVRLHYSPFGAFEENVLIPPGPTWVLEACPAIALSAWLNTGRTHSSIAKELRLSLSAVHDRQFGSLFHALYTHFEGKMPTMKCLANKEDFATYHIPLLQTWWVSYNEYRYYSHTRECIVETCIMSNAHAAPRHFALDSCGWLSEKYAIGLRIRLRPSTRRFEIRSEAMMLKKAYPN